MSEQSPEALHSLVADSAPAVWQACAALAGAEAAERLTLRTFQQVVSAGDDAGIRMSALLSTARAVCAAEPDAAAQRPGSPPTGVHAAATVHREWIVSVLAKEAPATREIFLLTALAGFSYVDVASSYGCSLRVVRDQVDAGRRRVFAALEDDGRIPGAGGW